MDHTEKVHFKFAALVLLVFIAVIVLSAWNQRYVENVAGSRVQLRAVEVVRNAVQKGMRAKKSPPSAAVYLDVCDAYSALHAAREIMHDDMLRNALGEDPAPLEFELGNYRTYLESQLT